SATRMVAGTAGVWANAPLAVTNTSAPSTHGIALPVMGTSTRHDVAGENKRTSSYIARTVRRHRGKPGRIASACLTIRTSPYNIQDKGERVSIEPEVLDRGDPSAPDVERFP